MPEPLFSASVSDADLDGALESAGLPWPPTMARRAETEAAAGGVRPLDPRLAGGLATLASPEAVMMVHHQVRGGVVRLATLSVSGDAVVEVVAGPVHHLSVWPAGSALDRVGDLTGMPDPTGPAAHRHFEVEVSGSALLALLGDAGRDPDRARRILQLEGEAGPAAEAAAEAVSTHTARYQVTAVRRPRPDRLVGATVAWIATEAAGLWEVVAPKLAESGDYGHDGDTRIAKASVRLVATEPTAILSELADALGEVTGPPTGPPSLPGRGPGDTITADQRREKP